MKESETLLLLEGGELDRFTFILTRPLICFSKAYCLHRSLSDLTGSKSEGTG